MLLEAILAPEHEEHKDMMRWSEMQEYKDFDIKPVKYKLKSELKWY